MVAKPLPLTKLSLQRWAKYAGLNPIHFAGGFVDNMFFQHQVCSNFWPRHAWQAAGHISHEDLAYAIRSAEETIEQVIGYPLAPAWIQETLQYPMHHRRAFTNTLNMNRQRTGVQASWGYVISGGKRGLTLVQAGAAVVYSDDDGDGFSETATVQVATTFDPCEVRVFHAGVNGDARWEIPDRRSVSASGGVVTIELDSWLMTDPDVRAAFPTAPGEYQAIDMTTTANFVTTVNVYRVYNDQSDQGNLIWESAPYTCGNCSGVGCAECAETTQSCCLIIRDGRGGYIVPVPGSYGTGWTSSELSVNRSPDRVLAKYYAGHVSEDYYNGLMCDPLDDLYARAVFYLSMARLDRPVCGCSNIVAMSEELRAPQATVSPEGNFLAISDDVQKNPFGTKVGEWRAWNMISRLVREQDTFVALV